MFRRLQDRISTAVFGDGEDDIQRLQALGFSQDQARMALSACSGDCDRAAEWLFVHQQPESHAAAAVQQPRATEDADLQRAMEQSRIDEDNRRRQQSAAARKAGAAALARHSSPATSSTTKPTKKKAANSKITKATPKPRANAATASSARPTAPLTASHPNVKLIPKLNDKSVEERLVRTAQRLQPYPAAVDILHTALSALRRDPTNPKFITIDTTTQRYQTDVAPAVGAEDWLNAAGYTKSNDRLRWYLTHYDAARVYLAVSSLEQLQETSTVYQHAKAELVMEQQMIRLLQQAATTTTKQPEETKAPYVPPEPAVGGARIAIQLLSSSATASSKSSPTALQHTIVRRFDGDDTVANVVDWLCTSVPGLRERLFVLRDWSLVDKNRNAIVQLNDEAIDKTTLQVAGLWPSGRLELRPTSVMVEHHREGAQRPSRGLGDGTADE